MLILIMLKRKYDNKEKPQSPTEKGGENTRDYNAMGVK